VKVASFTLRATMAQSVRWKRASEGEGFASVGSWAAKALDAYLEGRRRAGQPIPLAWRKGRFRVLLQDGQDVTLAGFVSEPFAAFRGNAEGPARMSEQYSLVYLPDRRIVASLRTYRQCKALASELAPIFARDAHDGAQTIERHVREQA
jgi:hypothetical protein